MNHFNRTDATFLVFALKPCQVLENAISRAKAKTRAVTGTQTYLDHPPHLTLYVSAFRNLENAAANCEMLAFSTPEPNVDIRGWYSFEGDALTGKQTLVCELDDASRSGLRIVQDSFIRRLAPLRDQMASEARYLPHFHALSALRQQAVSTVGFPFVADDWVPHFTIASIEPIKWKAAWEAIKDDAPMGKFTCPKLAVFQLENDHPQPWKEFSFRKSASTTIDQKQG